MSRTLGWFSCGAASAVAVKLTPEAEPVYCETRSEHPDSERFLADCEKWFGRKVTRLRSDKYKDTWDVWNKRRYLAGINGALCSVELKATPRLAYQKPDDIHVLGYTADKTDINRADRLRANYPEQRIFTPLIVRGLTKARCLEMIERAGIELPLMYKLGFHNNNCIPCVKAQSPAYWALVREHFPDHFFEISKLSRKLNMRLCRLNGVKIFMDEIPADHPLTGAIQPSCDFLCHLAEKEISEDAVA